MSKQQQNQRFGYLSANTQSQEQYTEEPDDLQSSGGRDELRSVPKGEGRMHQQRTQLNVRIPTALKRQATAQAILEGRDIGEVVEDLLRQYVEGST